MPNIRNAYYLEYVRLELPEKTLVAGDVLSIRKPKRVVGYDILPTTERYLHLLAENQEKWERQDGKAMVERVDEEQER